MAWYFNFCSPFLPNDSTINLHRLIQTCCVLALFLFYIALHCYFTLRPNTEKKEEESKSESNNSDDVNSKGKQSQQSSEQQDKSVSIAGGEGAQENSSYVTFDRKVPAKKKVTVVFSEKKSEKEVQEEDEDQQQKQFSMDQLKSYFPIVFGHFAVISTASITYSPYAEQSIAIFLYTIFSIILFFLNKSRKKYPTRALWVIMILLNLFTFMSALLELGQANYNKTTQDCFSKGYVGLY